MLMKRIYALAEKKKTCSVEPTRRAAICLVSKTYKRLSKKRRSESLPVMRIQCIFSSCTSCFINPFPSFHHPSIPLTHAFKTIPVRDSAGKTVPHLPLLGC